MESSHGDMDHAASRELSYPGSAARKQTMSSGGYRTQEKTRRGVRVTPRSPVASNWVARDPPPTKITSAAQDLRRDYAGLFSGPAVHEVTRSTRPVVHTLYKTAINKPAKEKKERLDALMDLAWHGKKWLETIEVINEEKWRTEREREQKKKMTEFERQVHELKRIAAVTNETQYITDLSGNKIAVEPNKNVIAEHKDLQLCVERRAWRAAC